MDRTREDIAQDNEIAALKAKVATLEKKIAATDTYDDRIRAVETKEAWISRELAKALLEFAQLEPLKKLAGFADHIHRSLGLSEETK